MADDRVIVIDMAKDQAGSDIARAAREGVKGLPLAGGIVQTSNNNAWSGTIAAWKAAGLPVATYWWPGWGNPSSEAAEAVARHEAAGATGGIMLDLEGEVPDGIDVSDWASRFLAYCDRVRSGVPAFYYSTRGWLSEHGVNLPGRQFVVAAYGDDRTDPDPPNPDEGAVLWQFTQHGRAPGFDGDVDLNVGHRDRVAALFGASNQGGLMPDDVATLRKDIANVNDNLNRLIAALMPLVGRIDKNVADDLKTDLAAKYDADLRAAGQK